MSCARLRAWSPSPPAAAGAPGAADRLAVRTDLALALKHPLLFSVHGHDGTFRLRRGSSGKGRVWHGGVQRTAGAGQEGLEPPTAGFGDRCSTS